MTSAGSVSAIPKFRKLSVFPSSFDCFLCSWTRATILLAACADGRDTILAFGNKCDDDIMRAGHSLDRDENVSSRRDQNKERYFPVFVGVREKGES
jgi:hypothetical protein